ncbi:MAG: hypothetical protein M3547_11400 [Acidobacteriota bacterium]|nr:hypothetical protein [Acidobacteriota bacterium]
MADRRNSQRLLVPAESLEHIDYKLPETPESDVTEETQPLRLSFLALLADRDPAVQARLERRRTLALADDHEDEEEDRPTDPMVMLGR